MRITPLEPPYEPAVADRLHRMMGGVEAEPLALFRLFVRNMPMAEAMARWGGYELGPKLSIDLLTRELIIDRVCARCGCEYEWQVHVAFFAPSAGLTRYGIEATKADNPTDPVLRLVDQLHDTARVSDELWAELSALYTDEQLLDMLMLAGWYHAICYTANAARLPLESIRT
jgi:alkylhydroperoxidase family enzyme